MYGFNEGLNVYEEKLKVSREICHNKLINQMIYLKDNRIASCSFDKTIRIFRFNETVNERQRSIISSVSSNPYITQAELATMLGISIVHVNKNMKKLQALGIIRRVGPDKGGHWEVVV